MTKRRRERDRPKAGPEAAYNPNKRVLLSYDSDEGEAQDAIPQAEKEAEIIYDQARLANYQMSEYTDEEGHTCLGAQSEATSPSMNGTTTNQQQDQTPAERRENEEQVQQGGKDVSEQGKGGLYDSRANVTNIPVTGQRQALGAVSLDEGDDAAQDGYDSATEEALAYLRGVQAERQGIPEVLAVVRQVSDQHLGTPENDDQAEEGYLVDNGTYIGRPDTSKPAIDDASDPRYAFTEFLMGRFLHQRQLLRLPPSAAKLAALGDDHPISFPQGNNKAYAEWHRILSSRSPVPAQLRSMDPDTVWNLLALLEKHYLVRGKNIRTVTSAWVWSLLAKLEEVGNMSNDEIFPLRRLGKKIVLLQLHFSDPKAAAQLESLDGQESSTPNMSPSQNGDEIVLVDDLASVDGVRKSSTDARRMSQPKLHQAKATENTLATLDMILVVIGDIYGQRDLLEFRTPWAQESEPASK